MRRGRSVRTGLFSGSERRQEPFRLVVTNDGNALGRWAFGRNHLLDEDIFGPDVAAFCAAARQQAASRQAEFFALHAVDDLGLLQCRLNRAADFARTTRLRADLGDDYRS